VSVTDASVALCARWLENCEERVLLLVSSLCSSVFLVLELSSEKLVSLCLSLFYNLCVISEDLSKLGVSLVEEVLNLCVVVSCPELEGSCSLEELSYTLWLLYTWKLNKDTSAVSELLDVWLSYTETVDTVSENVE
jgi:hypothetical protein